jgi:predicted  nucleic acid-binding Zn-ribbon protein
MDATAEAPIDPQAATQGQYSSRKGALVWFFRKSRDQWKAKCQAANGQLKLQKNRVADLSRSRDHWRDQAERAGRRAAALEAEVADLRARLESAEAEKKTTGPAAR